MNIEVRKVLLLKVMNETCSARCFDHGTRRKRFQEAAQARESLVTGQWDGDCVLCHRRIDEQTSKDHPEQMTCSRCTQPERPALPLMRPPEFGRFLPKRKQAPTPNQYHF